MFATCVCNETKLKEYEDLLKQLESMKRSPRYKILRRDFGKVPIGNTRVTTFKIAFDNADKNVYKIRNMDTIHPSYQVFSFSSYGGVLKQEKYLKISITYEPLIPYQIDVGNFEYTDQDGRIIKIVLRGEVIGPLLQFSARQLIFYKSPIKRKVVQIVEITNNSEAPAEFIFVCNMNPDLFQVEPSFGKIEAGTHVYVQIKFTPKMLGYFSQLLSCLVLYHPPYVINLFGWNSCEVVEPNRLQLQYLPRSFKEKYGYAAYLMDSMILRAVDTPVSISKIFYDFGRSIPGITLESSSFNATITNFTDHNIEVRWMEDDNIFTIIPKQVIVPPNTSSAFQVSFTPTETHKFYFRSLLGQIYWPQYDFSRSFLNVPLTVNFLLLGHSFPKNQFWIPIFKMTENIVFAPCLPGDTVYTNFKIENTGQLPIIFKIVSPKDSKIIVKPMIGYINNFVIISAQLKTDKNDQENYCETWHMVLNGCEENKYKFTFRGLIRYPTILFGKNDIIHMDTAQAGTETFKNSVVKNTSCFKLHFKVVVDYPAYLRIEPEESIVEAHDQRGITLYFQADLDAPTKITGTCKLRASTQSDAIIGEEFTHNFVIYCNSSASQLCCGPDRHDFGLLKWNAKIETTFFLFNFGDCTVYFKLDPIKNSNSFSFNLDQGKVEATKKLKIVLNGVANSLGENEFVVSYSNRKGPKSNEIIENSSKEIFRFSYIVGLFKIQITKVVDSSFGHLFSNHILWNYLNIDSLNTKIQNMYPDTTEKIDIRMPEFVESNEEYCITLCVKNITNLDEELTLKRKQICHCPMKQDKTGFNTCKLVYDCPHRELFNLELSEKTFSGSSHHLLFVRIKYSLPGTNTVAYTLNIGNNRIIEIHCTITCIEKDVDRISCYKTDLKMEFQNLFIGMWYGPLQTFWLYNNTNLTGSYTVDTTEIEDLCRAEGFKVLEILNPKGEIEPGCEEPLLIRFHPIETKTYKVNLPIILAHEEINLTLTGEGLPKKITTRTGCNKMTSPSETPQKNDIFLSTECLIFDQLCEWNKINKIIFIKNNSNSIFQYEWIDSSVKYIVDATAKPRYGLLLPKESHTIMITVSTYNEPIITNLDIVCMIYNINDIYLYTSSLKEYEEEERRLEGYFTITEKGTTRPKNTKVVLPKPTPRCIVLSLHVQILHSKDADELWTIDDLFSGTPRDVIHCDVSNITEPNAPNKRKGSCTLNKDHLDFDIIETAKNLLTEMIGYFVFSKQFEDLTKSSTKLFPPYYYQFTRDIGELLDKQRNSISLSLLNIEQSRKDIEKLFDRPSLPLLADTLQSLLFDTIHRQFHLGPPYPREKTKEEIDQQIDVLLRNCEKRKCICNK